MPNTTSMYMLQCSRVQDRPDALHMTSLLSLSLSFSHTHTHTHRAPPHPIGQFFDDHGLLHLTISTDYIFGFCQWPWLDATHLTLTLSIIKCLMMTENHEILLYAALCRFSVRITEWRFSALGANNSPKSVCNSSYIILRFACCHYHHAKTFHVSVRKVTLTKVTCFSKSWHCEIRRKKTMTSLMSCIIGEKVTSNEIMWIHGFAQLGNIIL
jgi:hypothetical protein